MTSAASKAETQEPNSLRTRRWWPPWATYRHISRCPVCQELFRHKRKDARCCSERCRDKWRNRAAQLGAIILAEWPEYARADKPLTPADRELIAYAITRARVFLIAEQGD
jgi:hypothetical protein